MTTQAAPVTADTVYRLALEEDEHVGAELLGNIYQDLLQNGARDQRKEQGSYYTPELVAQFVSRFSLDAGLRSVGPEPEQVMRIIACDPACGSGVFLVCAARHLAREFARRLVGGEPPGDLMLAVMPRVILTCIFGVDLDPVAVDLARLSLSLETAGALTPQMLARHIICGDTLDGASPPAMDERVGAAPFGPGTGVTL